VLKELAGPSHGRGHRFETCHAHEGKPQLRAPKRVKLMAPCSCLSGRVPSLFRRATEQHVQAVTQRRKPQPSYGACLLPCTGLPP
jgi:hypothetical protein